MSSVVRNRLVALVLLLGTTMAWYLGLLDPLRYRLYDLSQSVDAPLQSDSVIVVSIDRKTVRALKGYPLSQETQARVLRRLFSAGARQVGWLDLPDGQGSSTALDTGSPGQGKLVIGTPVYIGLADADDSRLPAHIRRFAIDEREADLIHALPASPVLSWQKDRNSNLPVYAPYPVNAPHESSAARAYPLMLRHSGMLIPTVALQMYINASQTGNAALMPGGGIKIGEARLWLDDHALAYPRLTNDKFGKAIETISLAEVLQDEFKPEQVRGKHVLIGVEAPGLVPTIPVPGGMMTPVQYSASTLASMIAERMVVMPAWASATAVVLAAVIAWSFLWIWPLGLMRGLSLALVPFSSLLALQFWSLIKENIWLDVSLPLTILLLCALQFWIYGRRVPVDNEAEMSAAEIHRRVGLASQKRGDLDAAFDSFRKCPLDNSIMVLLYYLALDYEKAESYDRALAVYRYMRSHDPGFRDISERAEKAILYQDTVMMETAGVMPDADTSAELDEEHTDETMLGRYLIKRRIGKGAMGMVYLGEDPKINRIVAIKTLNLKQEFGEDEQDDVLQRFFREAEAAGRLHHPNIVTIYDAGEANDMAYIAMEYLTGTDLRFYTKENSLLPPLTVVKIGIKLADALAYAHSRDIVHRDIKAANVMYDPQTGQLKITDFGIARLSDSRRTKTGMVLGTPSSMSPEQLRGKQLDGRTDLYSLGVLMFQLLTGRLPYKAESLTQLMAKITSAEPPDMLELRPELKENGECMCKIVYKLLEKEADDRYQDGKTLSRDLIKCAKSMAAKK